MTALSSIRKHPIATVAATLIAAVLVGWWLNPWHADAAGETESVYVGIEPTRCIDTRNNERVGPHGFFGANTTKTIQITGVTECGVPDGATAVLFNLSGIGATETTFITAYPTGSEPSTTSVLNSSPASRVVGNAVTVTLSDDGAIDMFNSAGVMNITIDVLGYYTPAGAGGTGGGVPQADFDALQATVAQQANTIDELTALLAGVERAPDTNGYDTITFTGVNLQLVDGTGTTIGTPSGLGNLILGYNEESPGVDENRNGAHNLVIGPYHAYGSNGGGQHAAGGIAAGYDSIINNYGASVTGGYENTATGAYSSITGGSSNDADASFATVTGGIGNYAGGEGAVVSGGSQNQALNSRSSVTGGFDNVVNSPRSTIVGGQENVVDAGIESAVVVGGRAVTAAAEYSVAVGGNGNSAGGQYSVAIGGVTNNAQADRSVTLGGLGGITTNDFAVSLYAPNNGLKNCDSTACAPSGTIEAYVALP